MSNHVKGMTSCRPPESETEKSNESQMDLINRRDAIDAVNRAVTKEVAIWSLKELPSAQPDISGYSDRLWRAAYERGKAEAQRTGKWIDDEGNAATDKYCATCSACGEWSEYLTAYCPNCGAKME